ncbi:TPA: nucleotidyltransferase domain-containing protein, partial [Candidatus Bathyarchaeota archaeon]|nr:nucleotidyltransferase domain-containing protein [Candidatus Bathyarchaeota archaeon]
MAEDIVKKLREALGRDENVLLAYLFGSRAMGVSSPISDYDVAVLLKNNDLR